MLVYTASVVLVRSIGEARFWLTWLQSACSDWIDYRKTATAKANAVLNKLVVAKRSSAKAKIATAKLPGSKT
jgi:hypothetical protein